MLSTATQQANDSIHRPCEAAINAHRADRAALEARPGAERLGRAVKPVGSASGGHMSAGFVSKCNSQRIASRNVRWHVKISFFVDRG
jgi:hypothetical protein